MPIILQLRRLDDENCYEFKANLVCKVSSRPALQAVRSCLKTIAKACYSMLLISALRGRGSGRITVSSRLVSAT